MKGLKASYLGKAFNITHSKFFVCSVRDTSGQIFQSILKI